MIGFGFVGDIAHGILTNITYAGIIDMKHYIEAYDLNNKQILGNLDGQGVIRAKQYRRTLAYKALSTLRTLNNRVHHYIIVTPNDTPVEKVLNLTHPANK